ncbi:hypothetical protein D3C85_1850430 [compost metagenome]
MAALLAYTRSKVVSGLAASRVRAMAMTGVMPEPAAIATKLPGSPANSSGWFMEFMTLC